MEGGDGLPQLASDPGRQPSSCLGKSAPTAADKEGEDPTALPKLLRGLAGQSSPLMARSGGGGEGRGGIWVYSFLCGCQKSKVSQLEN